MNIEKNIVAIGGGGFGRSVKDLRIEEYILSLSQKKIPKIFSMNNKNIYFHVGLAKTGSTFLQNNFFPKLQNIKYISTHKYRRCIDIINNTNYDSYLISREFDRQLEGEVKKILNHFYTMILQIRFRQLKKFTKVQY